MWMNPLRSVAIHYGWVISSGENWPSKSIEIRVIVSSFLTRTPVIVTLTDDRRIAMMRLLVFRSPLQDEFRPLYNSSGSELTAGLPTITQCFQHTGKIFDNRQSSFSNNFSAGRNSRWILLVAVHSSSHSNQNQSRRQSGSSVDHYNEHEMGLSSSDVFLWSSSEVAINRHWGG